MADSVSKKVSMRFLAVLVLLVGLLTACGDTNTNTTDLNFTLPVYNGLNELPNLASSSEFANKLLLSNDPTFSEKSVRVFSTNSALTDVKSYYVKELVNLGWNNRTVSLIGSDTLGTDGWVLGFEKPAGNNAGRSRGLFMVGPNANGTDNFLKPYRDSGAIPSGQNLLVIVEGVYSPNGTPAAPTATSRP